jgi:uncharacterized oligopeptide transporter (OPT) family protein
MLAGAIVGWAILSPLAMRNGWAHGPVGDWETGSRSWIIWVSLFCLMADAGVFLIWIVIEPVHRALDHQRSKYRVARHNRETSEDDPFLDSSDENASPPRNILLGSTTVVLCSTMAFSICLCIFSVHFVFNGVIPWYLVLLGILLALPMAVVGIRALAECDFNPESGLRKYPYPRAKNPNSRFPPLSQYLSSYSPLS